MWAAVTFAIAILRSLIALFRSRQNQAIVELALRQQLSVFAHRHPRPRLSPLDRAFWVALSRFLASMEVRSHRRSARDRDPLASRGIPPLLAFDLRARTGTATDLRRHREAH